MKTQMKFQKILTLITLIVAALAIVLALSFCSGIFTAAKNYVDEDNWGANEIYYYGNKINGMLLILAIVLLLTVVLLYVMGCNKRRKYYVTNYIAIGVFVLYALVFGIILLVICSNCLNLYNQIDFEGWREYEGTMQEFNGELRPAYNQYYNDNIATAYLGIVMFVVLLVNVTAWVLNLVWKIKLMKGEKALLEQGAVEDKAELEVA